MKAWYLSVECLILLHLIKLVPILSVSHAPHLVSVLVVLLLDLVFLTLILIALGECVEFTPSLALGSSLSYLFCLLLVHSLAALVDPQMSVAYVTAYSVISLAIFQTLVILHLS